MVPWPADFGGVQDIFNCIVALHRQGVLIQLHCFTNAMDADPGPLKKYCDAIFLYKRKIGIRSLSATIPYIVKSRTSAQLDIKLAKDNFPILIQGVHCSALLNNLILQNRKIAIRLFNVESNYYAALAKLEKSWWKKFYYKIESKLLKRYERKVAAFGNILCISKTDQQFYHEQLAAKSAYFLPAFTGFTQSKTKAGLGDFILYQANLSVNENEAVAIWLVNNIADHISLPLVIAGKRPGRILLHHAEKKPSVKVIANPGKETMEALTADAQINLVHSYNTTGVKLKLLNALFYGSHCVGNLASVAGSGLESLLELAENDSETIEAINRLSQQPMEPEKISERTKALSQIYNDDKNANFIRELLL